METASTSIRLTREQAEFCKRKGKNISWYIRSLIDKEIGAERFKLELEAKRKAEYYRSNTFVFHPGQNNKGQMAPK